jgi:hypothetical protein
MTELERLKKRREELKKIAQAPSTNATIRLAAQAELNTLNARIKAINIETADALKRAADARNAAGQAENRANLVRSEMNVPPKVPPINKPLHTGEYVLVLAKRLRAALGRVKSPLPHTVTFVGELDAFILSQKQHAAEFNARVAASRAELRASLEKPATEAPSEWAQTWQTGRASE